MESFGKVKEESNDEGEDDDVMHVDDLEKARVQQAKEAAELEKAKEEASDKTE